MTVGLSVNELFLISSPKLYICLASRIQRFKVVCILIWSSLASASHLYYFHGDEPHAVI